jgi:hypothetical protein
LGGAAGRARDDGADSGLCATVGALIVVLAGPSAPVIAGSGCSASGSRSCPTGVTAARRIDAGPGRSIAGDRRPYRSGLIAPDDRGIAHLSSLTVSFVVVIVLVALIGLRAQALRPAPVNTRSPSMSIVVMSSLSS